MAARKRETVTVVSQEQLADGIFSMWIQTEAAKTARPGQFISMYTNDGSKLLPRPISICEIDTETSKLRVVYRVTCLLYTSIVSEGAVRRRTAACGDRESDHQ